MRLTRITDPDLHNYRLTFPDGTKWRTGYVYVEVEAHWEREREWWAVWW